MGPRKELVKQGVRFLLHPKVQNSPMSEKLKFLEKKGLTQEEITLAREEAELNSQKDSSLSTRKSIIKTVVPPSKELIAAATSAKAGERLKDRIVVVFGTEGGLCKSIVIRCKREGAIVITVGKVVNEDSDVSNQDSTNTPTKHFEVDLLVKEDVDKAIASIANDYGRLDVVINNAAILHQTSMLETLDSDWDKAMNTYGKMVFISTRRAIQQMLTQDPTDGVRGRIINISSLYGISGSSGMFTHGIGQAIVNQMTRLISSEHGPHGIICNSILPGNIVGDNEKSQNDSRIRLMPGRVGRSLDVANAVIYLASDESTFIQGTNLVVDGGVLASSL